MQRKVYDRFRGFACKIVFRYIYRYEKVVDVVTDGFVKLFSNFEQFRYNNESDAEKQLMGWVRKIMINCAIDELRKNNMIHEIGQIDEEVWNIDSRSDEADQAIIYKDLINVVKELPAQYRTIFNLYVLDDFSHSEIGELMKISVSTSRSSLTRARAFLKERISKMEESKVCSI